MISNTSRLHKSARVLFAITVIATAAFLPTVQATTITSFEASEGFILGPIGSGDDGQAGWTGSAQGTLVVTDAEAFSGTQSLAVSAGNSAAKSPDLSALAYRAASYHFKTSSAPQPGAGVFSRTRTVLGTPGSEVTTALEFNIRRVANDYEISVFSWDDTDTRSTQWLVLDSSFNPRNWNSVTINFSASDLTYSLSVNDSIVSGASALSLPSTVTADSRINELWFYNHTASAYSGTLYYDAITAPAIPESSFAALAILATSAAAALRIRRKRSSTNA